ncbi:hypothetical protein COCOR_01789 [Corallococcus coralloides DSM 2259]|uniref:DUF481 domain-containing protein n=1 Tax=Corallococcus coralloides (strain ATCC 25202 / DSM 2259 / NBRC 100086 / M2) TaxID=1144275 RepID=H8N1I1_CORCM|nr:DUF481 domain-containing protein [Corallococcus coralloides]AFE04288.1 hypothetical protein COCOR_01789 [Corallococcus coralloides DSM 2259]
MSPLFILFAAMAQTPTPPSEAADASSPASVASATEDEDEDEGPWTGSAGLGASMFTGNARAFTITGDAMAEYESPVWALTLEADGAYGNAASEDEEEREVTALTLGGWARGDYRFTRLLSAYSFLGLETDHPASLELRTEVELGVGLTFLERKKKKTEKELFLRTYLGASYAKDRRFQYTPTREDLPNVTLWSPAVGLAFRYDINERVHLREDAIVLPGIFDNTRVLLDSTTKLSVHLTDRFALTTYFELQHDSAPAAGKVKTDTSLSVGGELEI